MRIKVRSLPVLCSDCAGKASQREQSSLFVVSVKGKEKEVLLDWHQDEEDPEDIADPGEGVQEVDLPRRVLGDEEVE